MCQDSPHEFKFTIRGDEADAPLRLKFTELDTLVESAVIDGNALALLVTRPIDSHHQHTNVTTVGVIISSIQSIYMGHWTGR